MERVTDRLMLWMSGWIAWPESVLAAKYRNFPSASNTGSEASLIPSVTWVVRPVSSE